MDESTSICQLLQPLRRTGWKHHLKEATSIQNGSMTCTSDGTADPAAGNSRDGELGALTKRISRTQEMVPVEVDDEDDVGVGVVFVVFKSRRYHSRMH